MAKKHFYGYIVDNDIGIVESWAECQRKVHGKRSKFKGFATKEEALKWIEMEVNERKGSVKPLGILDDAIFFDSGTGRGIGCEVSVCDRNRTQLAYLVVPKEHLTEWGTVLLSPGRTNNYGELLGCLLAIKVAQKLSKKRVCGDSKLVLDFWSKGVIGKGKMEEGDQDFFRLIEMTVSARKAFESDGGELCYIPGDKNPADLGFHRP